MSNKENRFIGETDDVGHGEPPIKTDISKDAVAEAAKRLREAREKENRE